MFPVEKFPDPPEQVPGYPRSDASHLYGLEGPGLARGLEADHDTLPHALDLLGHLAHVLHLQHAHKWGIHPQAQLDTSALLRTSYLWFTELGTRE